MEHLGVQRGQEPPAPGEHLASIGQATSWQIPGSLGQGVRCQAVGLAPGIAEVKVGRTAGQVAEGGQQGVRWALGEMGGGEEK